MTESENRTLPLFDDLDPAPAAVPAAPLGRVRADEERHLRAAWRLSRAMWRFPEHSAEETRAGIAICRHLRALLADQQTPAGR